MTKKDIKSQCLLCKHYYIEESQVWYWYCKAFPKGKGIPEAIVQNIHDHKKAFKGDNGIRFDEREE